MAADLIGVGVTRRPRSVLECIEDEHDVLRRLRAALPVYRAEAAASQGPVTDAGTCFEL
jgi:hypothetical protein